MASQILLTMDDLETAVREKRFREDLAVSKEIEREAFLARSLGSKGIEAAARLLSPLM